ncbi:MAG: hypothetical protein RLZZ182_2700 [Pseudomonadota bacterium]|jgi:CRISPR-associated protein Cas1
MSTLLLDRSRLELRSEGGALAVYEAGERRGTVPVSLLDRCIIHGASTRLDSGVLLQLAEAGVSTVLFSPRTARRVAIVLGPSHNDAAVRLAQARRVHDDARCRAWALGLVRAKLRRQLRLQRQWLAARPDARKPLTDASQALAQALSRLPQMPLAGADLPDLATLRGIEGAAARAHFAGLAAVVPPSLGFTGRNRRPPRDPVNVLLSLGYTLLHAEAVQACHAAGIDPLLGFYHQPSWGRESMASDLMEPLRPAIDAWAWQMVRSRTLTLDHFSMDRGACLLGKAGRAEFYGTWAKDLRPWRRCLRHLAMRLVRELRAEGEPWLAHADDADDEAGIDDTAGAWTQTEAF